MIVDDSNFGFRAKSNNGPRSTPASVHEVASLLHVATETMPTSSAATKFIKMGLGILIRDIQDYHFHQRLHYRQYEFLGDRISYHVVYEPEKSASQPYEAVRTYFGNALLGLKGEMDAGSAAKVIGDSMVDVMGAAQNMLLVEQGICIGYKKMTTETTVYGRRLGWNV